MNEPCPHCGLPAVLPEQCTPELNAVLERNMARDGELFEAGRQHGIAYPPAPVVAEVRRVGLDLQDFSERAAKAGGKVRFTGVEVDQLLAEVSRLRAERDEITGTPERWMRWCDHRVLELAEQAEADLATLRARLRELEQQMRKDSQAHADDATRKRSRSADDRRDAELSRVHLWFANQLAALLPPPTET